MPGPWGGRIIPLTAITAVVASAMTLVALTLRQPNLPSYAPTRPAPRDSGHTLVGSVLYTVDATSSEQWRYFSFHLGSVIENAGPKDWDLAFRRHQVIANGGAEFAGSGGFARDVQRDIVQLLAIADEEGLPRIFVPAGAGTGQS